MKTCRKKNNFYFHKYILIFCQLLESVGRFESTTRTTCQHCELKTKVSLIRQTGGPKGKGTTDDVTPRDLQ